MLLKLNKGSFLGVVLVVPLLKRLFVGGELVRVVEGKIFVLLFEELEGLEGKIFILLFVAFVEADEGKILVLLFDEKTDLFVID